jgi:tetratricopeptide (TPR) repeat protein
VWQDGTVSKFNWATVAEHELMHVFSLQITNYRIPRWLTEGMSVYEEVVPRIELDPLFASAARTNRLIKVQALNRQMTRPTARMNPLLAYYQARRIVEFIYEKHGMEGMTRLLGECRQGHKIEKAIPAAFNCSMDEFEGQVLEHQKNFATNVIRLSGAVDKATLTKLKLAVKEKPDDPEALADLAAAYLQGKQPDFKTALTYANKAVAAADKGPGVSRAYAVLGLIAFKRDKKFRRSRELFEKSVAADEGNAAAHLYLGVCAGKEGKSRQAIEHLLKARELAPRKLSEPNVYEELYTVYRDIEEDDKALEMMRERVAVDKLDIEKAIRLGKLALGRKKWKLAAWAAFQAIKVDPFAADPHMIWGKAAQEMKDFAAAEREWRLASTANVTSVDARVGLARALLAQGRKSDALAAANEAKALEPDRPDLPGLIQEIEKSEEKAQPRKVDLKDIKELQQQQDAEKPAEKKEQPVEELEKIDACIPSGRLVA